MWMELGFKLWPLHLQINIVSGQALIEIRALQQLRIFLFKNFRELGTQLVLLNDLLFQPTKSVGINKEEYPNYKQGEVCWDLKRIEETDTGLVHGTIFNMMNLIKIPLTGEKE